VVVVEEQVAAFWLWNQEDQVEVDLVVCFTRRNRKYLQ
jgi:hypothetical protein